MWRPQSSGIRLPDITTTALTAFTIITSADPLSAQLAIAGDCSIIVQEITNSDVTITNDVCGNAYKVRYVWIDARSFQLLEAGFTNEAFQQVFGRRPYILKAGAYSDVEDLLRVGSVNTDWYYDIFLGDELATSADDLRSEASEFDGQENVFVGDEPIIWPAAEMEQYYREGRWPDGVNYCYPRSDEIGWLPGTTNHGLYDYAGYEELKSDPTGIARYEVSLSRTVPAVEFNGYWDLLDSKVDLINDISQDRLENSIKEDDYYYYYFFGDPTGRTPGLWWPPTMIDNEENEIFEAGALTTDDWERATPPSYNFIRYVTRGGFPEDFLLLYGELSVDDCGGSLGFSFSVIPRHVTILSAIVEPISASVTINGLSFSYDERDFLRADLSYTPDLMVTYNMPQLSKGDSLIIPLRIELQYGKDGRAQRALDRLTVPEEGRSFYAQLEGIRSQNIELSEPSGFSSRGGMDTLSGMLPPSYPLFNETYYYGRAYTLDEIRVRDVDGRDEIREVRDTPQFAMLTMSGWPESSCPFLEFVDADGDVRLYGRVLVGSDSVERMRSDVVPIPAGTEEIFISEREPEVSFIKEVSLEIKSSGERLVLARDIQINPQESVSFEVPERFNQDAFVVITGYYRVLQ